MTIYFNCYVPGEGYIIKRTRKSEESEPTEINRKDVPEALRSVFLTGETVVYFDRSENMWYGCVRNVESYFREENGRNCFLNIAFEADETEQESVCALVNYAYRHRSSFAALLGKVIHYDTSDYGVDMPAFDRLCQKSAENKDVMEAPLRISPAQREQANKDFRLFLYCSTPSSGFVLRRIDPETGESFPYGRKPLELVDNALLPKAKELLYQRSEKISIFQSEGRECLVVKDIRSQKKDAYGRRKEMSFVLDAPIEEHRQMQQLFRCVNAGWETFVEELTDCVSVFDGPVGYRVNGERLWDFLNRCFGMEKTAIDAEETTEPQIEADESIQVDEAPIDNVVESHTEIPKKEPDEEANSILETRTDEVKNDYGTEVETVNLLDYPWFVPLVIAVVLLFCGVIAGFILLR